MFTVKDVYVESAINGQPNWTEEIINLVIFYSKKLKKDDNIFY